METTFIKDIRPDSKNINLTFIVLEVGHPVPLKENREVRTLKVADATACINMSLWDEPGKLLAPGDIVRLSKGYASLWRNCLTLYCSKNGDLDKIGEFCMVFNEQLNMSEPNINVTPNQPPASIQNNGNGGRRSLSSVPQGSAPSSQPGSGGKNPTANRPFSNETQTGSGNKPSAKPSQRGGRGGHKNNIRSDRR